MSGYFKIPSPPEKLSQCVLTRLLSLAAISLACLAMSAPASAKVEQTRTWKIICDYVNSAPDDPIVFPNRPGASHLHDFFGNVGISASTTTFDDLNTFASNCPQEDRSAYWVPAVYQNGKKLTPGFMLIYYQNKSLAAGKVHAFPPGFKYVMGNPNATDLASTEQHWIWACAPPNEGKVKTNYGHIPPTTCVTGAIQLRSEFPNCWDGKLEPDGNAAGHLVWANGLAEPGHGDRVPDPVKNDCPAGYSIPLPMIRLVTQYETGNAVGTITLSSGNGSPYTKHGDFFNAWDPKKLQDLIDRCLNTPNATCSEHLEGKTAALPTTAQTIMTRMLRLMRTAEARLTQLGGNPSISNRSNMCSAQSATTGTALAFPLQSFSPVASSQRMDRSKNVPGVERPFL